MPKIRWDVVLMVVGLTVFTFFLCSLATAGEPIIQVSSNQREQIKAEQTERPLTTDQYVTTEDLQELAEQVREQGVQIRLLTNEMSMLVDQWRKHEKECDQAYAKLQNKVWKLENPGTSYPGQTTRPKAKTSRRAGAKVVDQWRGDYAGTRNAKGAWWIRQYSDGRKTRARIQEARQPVRRAVAAVARPVRRVMAPVQRPVSVGSAYMPRSNMGWGRSMFGGGAMGGAACVGSS